MLDNYKIGFWTCTALVVGNSNGIFVLPASLPLYAFMRLRRSSAPPIEAIPE